jgi:hypothetical protein
MHKRRPCPAPSFFAPRPALCARLQAQRLSSENEVLLKQVEGLTLARAEMLRQVQDLTDKWQQSIAENA